MGHLYLYQGVMTGFRNGQVTVLVATDLAGVARARISMHIRDACLVTISTLPFFCRDTKKVIVCFTSVYSSRPRHS